MKKKSTALFILFLLSTNFSAPAQQPDSGRKEIYHSGWIDLNKNGRKDIYEDPQADIERRIDDLLRRMTVEEKTCQTATLYGFNRVLKDELPTPEWKNRIWKDGIANIDEHLNGWGPGANSVYARDIAKHIWAMNEVQRFFIEDTRHLSGSLWWLWRASRRRVDEGQSATRQDHSKVCTALDS